MSVDTIAEHTEPELGPHDPILEAQDNAALERWLAHHTVLVGEIEKVLRVHIHRQGLTGASKAKQAVQNVERHDAMLASALDRTSHGGSGFAFGAALIILLVALDAISLDWTAQAFDLDSSGTWLVTTILVVLFAGAMLRFEPTRRDVSRYCLLAAVAVAGYLALLELRAESSAPIADESPRVVLLQAATLIAISAGLVLCSSAMLARLGSPPLSRSRAAARCARQDVGQARTAQQKTAYTMQRYLDGLRHILLRWAMGPAAPAGVDRATRATAFGRTIHRSFAAS